MTTKTTRRAKSKASATRLRKQLDGSLNQLTHAELVRQLNARDAEYIFKHALVQDSAYASLLKQERARLHLEIARCLEMLHAGNLDEIAARLAQHYAEAGDDGKTAEYSERAGNAAARAFANTEATAHFLRALRAIENLPDTVETRRKRIDLILKYDEYSWGAGDADTKLTRFAEIETLTRSLPDVNVPASPDRMRLAYVHRSQGSAYFARGDVPTALPYFLQALDEADGSNDARMLASTSALIAGVWIFQGHFLKAMPYIEQTRSAARDLPHTWYNMAGHVYYAQTLAALGRFGEAIQEMREVLPQEQAAGYHTGVSMSLTLLSIVNAMAHANEQAISFATEALDASHKSNEALYTVIAHSSRCIAESRIGQGAAARADLEQTLALLKQAGGQSFGGDWVMAACAETALNLGEMEQAITLAGETVSYAQRVGGLYAEGVARRVWAQALAQQSPELWDEIERQLETSVSLLEACAASPELARTHLAWGKILCARGESEPARVHLRQAAKFFQASELHTELAETRELLNEGDA